MKAKVGEMGEYPIVQLELTCYLRPAEIVEIKWPKFKLARLDSRGELMERWRHYRSLCGRAEPSSSRPTDRDPPVWLNWPKKNT